MKYKLMRSLKYVLQGISFLLFIFLFTKLIYPLDSQAGLLKWLARVDPGLLMSHLRWEHSLPVWGWLSLITLGATLIWGRVFCGWFCPFGALLMFIDKMSEIVFKNKLFKKVVFYRKKIIHQLLPLRYFWLLFLAGIFVFGSNWPLFFTPYTLFSHEIIKISQGAVPWLLIFISVCTLFFSRLWCSVFCPTGMLLSLLAKCRLFGYQVSGNCSGCMKCSQVCSAAAAPVDTGTAKEGCQTCGECQKACPVHAISWMHLSVKSQKSKKALKAYADTPEVKNKYTRRAFLKTAFVIAGAAAVWKSTAQTIKQVLRPPGALQENEFIAVCNRCGRCIKVCPNNALQPMSVTEGIDYFETPYIIPREANCSLCLSCQEVCPTGAIAKVPLEQVKIGSAIIDKTRCLAWSEGKMCFICGEQCPALAIAGDGQHRPSTLSDKCLGCGVCEKACPVDGEAAIRVLPRKL